jgi:Ca-activated chloride channel family protein
MRPSFRSVPVTLALVCALAAHVSGAPPGSDASAYTARVTQVDRTQFPKITVYTSITDASGKPLSASPNLSVEVLEGEEVVYRGTLFTAAEARPPLPPATAVVLVLDCSGSMAGGKFQGAQAAARSFVRLAPPGYSFAVVRFDTTTEVRCALTDDRAQAIDAIDKLRVGGNTALQDGIGVGLELLRGRTGRRLVLTLTDGEENASTRWTAGSGKKRLLDEANADGTTISIIGLGTDVQTSYLQEFQKTGGFYLFSPSEAELQSRFRTVQETLRSEWQFEYTSPHPADGRRRPVTVKVLRGGETVATDARRYVSPGLVPSVRGEHWPFVLLLLGLAVGPRLLRTTTGVLATQRFRTRQLIPLPMADPCVGRPDPNGGTLSAGDPVVVCPSCGVPHHTRSWRLNNCKCMRDGNGTGRVCYHAVLPRWLRRLLDRLSGGQTTSCGRKWLCRCAGDEEGY